MLKKIMFTLLSLIMIYSTAAVLYRIFEPESEINTDTRTVSLDYDSLNEYLLSTSVTPRSDEQSAIRTPTITAYLTKENSK